MSLNARIARFYDRSSPIWLETWGEQMHHGYYDSNTKDHKQAQLEMIERLLEWGHFSGSAPKILDAGCGVGGSSRYLVNKFPGATSLGLTLSPLQVERGRAYNQKAGLGDRIELRAQDVFELKPKDDGPFDLIWSLESAEHMADKEGLLKLFFDALKPGGQLIMATWCSSDSYDNLNDKEVQTLRRIEALYHLPPMVSIETLHLAAQRVGWTQIASADWSKAVEPFWSAVIKTGLDPRNWPGLIKAGSETIKGAWAMRYMRRGFKLECIKYGLLRAQKPMA
ncbi:MAG: methyltransferase domain-containing protein [Bacteroidota bacterium]